MSGPKSDSHVQSFGDRQNSAATPYLPEDKLVSVRESQILQVLKTLAKPEILPPNSSRPVVGGIDNLTFNRLPGLNVPIAVSKYKPPGLTSTVQPVWDFSAAEPTLRHDKSSFIGNRLYFRLSDPLIRGIPV